MKGYKFNFKSTCIEPIEPAEEYGEWYAEYENSLLGISPVNVAPDVVTNVTPRFAVWVEYSTGDSFGRGHNNEVEGIGLFADITSANMLCDFIWMSRELRLYCKDVKKEPVFKQLQSRFNVTYQDKKLSLTTPDGQVFALRHFPWVGYFETLNATHVTDLDNIA